MGRRENWTQTVEMRSLGLYKMYVWSNGIVEAVAKGSIMQIFGVGSW